LTIDAQFNHRLGLLIHSIGLSCLGGAIFLQILVFSNILEQGYFRAVEANTYILTIEMTLTIFTAAYFIYLYQKTIRTNLKRYSGKSPNLYHTTTSQSNIDFNIEINHNKLHNKPNNKQLLQPNRTHSNQPHRTEQKYRNYQKSAHSYIETPW